MSVKQRMKRLGKRALNAAGLIVQSLPSRNCNAVLVTFDDGPHPEITPVVLDILDSHGARACFFVVGKFVEAEPDLVRDMVRRGHIVGNHTQTHSKRRLGPRSYAEEVMRCQRTLQATLGAPPVLFRPIRGEVTFGSLYAALRLHTPQILWSCGGGEWSEAKTDNAQTIGSRLVKEVGPRDIVLLHDNNPKVPAILEHVLPRLRTRDLDLASGAECLLEKVAQSRTQL